MKRESSEFFIPLSQKRRGKSIIQNYITHIVFKIFATTNINLADDICQEGSEASDNGVWHREQIQFSTR